MSADGGANQKMPSTDLEDARKNETRDGVFTPTLHQKLIIYMLGLTSLIVAMDASIIPTTLAVSLE